MNEKPVALGRGHGAKNGPAPTPSVKLVVLESIAAIAPVTWLGSSSTADAVKEMDGGGPHALGPGPAPVVVNVPGVTVT